MNIKIAPRRRQSIMSLSLVAVTIIFASLRLDALFTRELWKESLLTVHNSLIFQETTTGTARILRVRVAATHHRGR